MRSRVDRGLFELFLLVYGQTLMQIRELIFFLFSSIHLGAPILCKFNNAYEFAIILAFFPCFAGGVCVIKYFVYFSTHLSIVLIGGENVQFTKDYNAIFSVILCFTTWNKCVTNYCSFFSLLYCDLLELYLTRCRVWSRNLQQSQGLGLLYFSFSENCLMFIYSS